MNIDPRSVDGPWDAGFTLDVHTVSAEFLGYDLDGRPQFDTVRSELGEKLYRLKYRGDRDASTALAAVAADFIKKRRIGVDIVVAVPPSKGSGVSAAGGHCLPVGEPAGSSVRFDLAQEGEGDV